jgi:hypothetical protein
MGQICNQKYKRYINIIATKRYTACIDCNDATIT